MIDHGWLSELMMMVHRNPELGLESDLHSMTIEELRGLYNWLKRVGN